MKMKTMVFRKNKGVFIVKLCPLGKNMFNVRLGWFDPENKTPGWKRSTLHGEILEYRLLALVRALKKDNWTLKNISYQLEEMPCFS